MHYGEGQDRFFFIYKGLWYAADLDGIDEFDGSFAVCKRKRIIPSENSKERLLALLALLFLPGVFVGYCITYGCYRQRIKTASSKGKQRANIQIREIQPQNTQHGFVQPNQRMQQNLQYLPNHQMQQNLQYLPNQQQPRSPPRQVLNAPRANTQHQEGVIYHGNQPTCTEGAPFSPNSRMVIKA